MANWFKIYETDLDEKRLKYALNKLPEVGWVWIGILSECCKHRSDTIRYSQSEIDLFGFSDALKVSIPKINAAVNLLSEIEYIEKGTDFIKVLKWSEKQSEYNSRKVRGDYRRTSENIGESPLEERRGEERRKRGEVPKTTETPPCHNPNETRQIHENEPIDGDARGRYHKDSRTALHILNEASGKHFRETDANLTVISARLREPEVTIDGVRVMIERQCKRWKDTPQSEYLRPETLFGKTKFDGYYAAKDLPINNGSNRPPEQGQLQEVIDVKTLNPQ